MTTKLTIGTITHSGGIIHFLDNTRALVNSKDHHISKEWKEGDVVQMVRQRGDIPGTFHLHSSEDEFVDCVWYSGNEQIV